MSYRVLNCWICGDPANSAEHKTKRSDLRSVFGQPSQAKPLFLHNQTAPNIRVTGLNSRLLKSPSLICANCNNTRTQPHDQAWEQLSLFARGNRPHLRPGAVLRGNRVFPYGSRRQMLFVHLYFLKLLGCHALEGGVPLDTGALGTAILFSTPHPRVFLKFGRGPSLAGRGVTGMSNLHTILDTHTGMSVVAVWEYYVDGFAVRVMFVEEGTTIDELAGAWHPSRATNRLEIFDFTQ